MNEQQLRELIEKNRPSDLDVAHALEEHRLMQSAQDHFETLLNNYEYLPREAAMLLNRVDDGPQWWAEFSARLERLNGSNWFEKFLNRKLHNVWRLHGYLPEWALDAGIEIEFTGVN